VALSRVEFCDQLRIRGGKLKIDEILRFHPAQVGNLEQPWFTVYNRAIEEIQADGFRRIIVLDSEKLVLDSDFDAELFHDFTLKSSFQGFAGFDFAAGKLP
jgi:hypothetical protein